MLRQNRFAYYSKNNLEEGKIRLFYISNLYKKIELFKFLMTNSLNSFSIKLCLYKAIKKYLKYLFNSLHLFWNFFHSYFVKYEHECLCELFHVCFLFFFQNSK